MSFSNTDQSDLQAIYANVSGNVSREIMDATQVERPSTSTRTGTNISSTTPSSSGIYLSSSEQLQPQHSEVDCNRLQHLINLNLSKTKIARILGISRPTLYQFFKDNGILQHSYSNISNEQLDEAIRKIKENHPAAGEVMTAGHLHSRGIRVQRRRLRQSLHRVDSAGIDERRLHTITRRTYSVPSPNYIWHLDGTHKLIKWKFVVHACIDGYSRLITFCYCSTNNKSATVLQLFQQAVSRYGLPLRVRTDHGVENVRVWEHMLRERANSSAVIAGSSVHNQRVERLHRDINTQVLNRFYNDFIDLENADLLDSANETDLFCLHLTYLPKINKCLEEFVDASNNHSLSTECQQTPLQLFHLNLRLLQLQSLPPSGTVDLNDIIEHSNNNVQVPPVANPFNSHSYQLLSDFLNQLVRTKASDMYEAVVGFAAELLS